MNSILEGVVIFCVVLFFGVLIFSSIREKENGGSALGKAITESINETYYKGYQAR